jgi:hypothetical protein
VTVTPVAVDASAAVTSVQASTLEMSLGEGDGVGLGLLEEAEGELDDPHATSSRPAMATTAIALRMRAKPRRVGAVAAGLNLEPVVSQGTGAVSTVLNGGALRPIESSAVPR